MPVDGNHNNLIIIWLRNESKYLKVKLLAKSIEILKIFLVMAKIKTDTLFYLSLN